MPKKGIFWAFNMTDILSVVKTRESGVGVLEKIDAAIEATYTSSFKPEKLDKLGLPVDLVKHKMSTPELIDALNEARSQITDANIVTLTVALDLEEKFVSKLYKWFASSGLQNFLLDIKVDPSIYGGALVSLNGKYADASLRKGVSEYVKHEYRI